MFHLCFDLFTICFLVSKDILQTPYELWSTDIPHLLPLAPSHPLAPV